MILLCGGEGAAGVKTGGAFFLLLSYGGPNKRGGYRGVDGAARPILVDSEPPLFAWSRGSDR